MLAPRRTLWSSPPEVVAAGLAALNLGDTDMLADFGCGTAGALISAAQHWSVPRAVGYEIDAERAEEARAAVAAAGLSDRVHIVCGNALEVEPEDAITAVYSYLTERGLRLMLPVFRKLAARLPSRTLRVVTILYRIPGVAPVHTSRMTLLHRPECMYPIALYHITPEAEACACEPSGDARSSDGAVSAVSAVSAE